MSLSWMEVVNHLLQTNATHDVIAETGMDLQNFKRYPSMPSNDYKKVLPTKAVRCNQVYTEDTLHGIIVEGLPDFICNSMRPYWTSNNSSTLHNLARRVTFVSTLQGEIPHHQTGNSNTNRTVVKTEVKTVVAHK